MPDSRRPLRFVLDGRPVSIDRVEPSTTLLDWLRTDARRTGTKEGCAEGDCGACTVVLARRGADGQVRAEPCNACIRPLASVDGAGVLTVEGLAGDHPVQRALVDAHGSQCGFCTPGFVTAMTARLADGPVVSDAQACEALAGNLCRCTGYRPIVAALHAASDALHGVHGTRGARSGGPSEGGGTTGLPDWVGALPAPDATPLEFEVEGRRWLAPRDARTIDALLADTRDAWLLAGGTDIGLWVTKQLREPACWIWLGAVDALQRVTVDDRAISIGAAVSLADGYRALCADWPELARYASRFASPAIRASGTLVGNLANGSPIGDTAPVLIALDATVVLRRRGADGPVRRTLPLAALYRDYRVQDRAPGEWLERVDVPRRGPHRRLSAHKLSKRVEQDISAVSLVLACDHDGGTMTGVRVALGGMAAIVRRAPTAEAVLEGAVPTPEVFARAGEALAADFTPLDDARASRDYRLAAAAGLLRRAGLEQFPVDGRPTSLEDPAMAALLDAEAHR